MAHSVALLKGEAGAGLEVPVNDERFWRRRAEDVPVDEAFFHAYFVRKNEKERMEIVGRREGKRKTPRKRTVCRDEMRRQREHRGS